MTIMEWPKLKNIYICFPGGRHKVLTMSFDDGRVEDRQGLESVMGYPVRGLAYPNGSWTPEIAAMLPSLGIRYARVVGDTHDFAIPNDFMTWKSTCHHTHQLLEDGKRFAALFLSLIHI